MNVHGATTTVVIDPPNTIEQLLAAEDATAVLAEKCEQCELLMGELDEAAIDGYLVRGQVDAHRLNLDALFAGELAALPFGAADARVQLDWYVWDQHEIIETIVGVEPLSGVHSDGN